MSNVELVFKNQTTLGWLT